MNLLNFSQYAKHRGVSVEAVSKAVRTGRITVVTTPDGQRWINPETADAEWTRNSDASKQIGGQAAADAAREKREIEAEQPTPLDHDGKLALPKSGDGCVEDASPVLPSTQDEPDAPAGELPESASDQEVPDGPAEPIDDDSADAAPPPEESASTGYAKHRANREYYQAALARVAYEEKLGRLVPADDVKAEYFRLARMTREAILNLPDRIAAEVHALTSAEAVADFLREQLEEALMELTRAG